MHEAYVKQNSICGTGMPRLGIRVGLFTSITSFISNRSGGL